MARRLITLAALALCAMPAQAQFTATQSEQAGFFALLLTPAGALPQVVQPQRQSRGAVALRYGRYALQNSFQDASTFINYGASGSIKVVERLHAGATIGYRTCDVCEGLTMGSVDLSGMLYHKGAGGEIGGSTDIQLQASAGIGSADTSDVRARSVTVSVPFAVSLAQENRGLLTLFVAPGFGYGYLKSPGVDDGATRFAFAAGAGYAFGNGLGVHGTVHRIVIEDSPTQIGVALTWRFAGAGDGANR